MPNVGALLKEEILRLARKEARVHTEPLKKSSAQHRRVIATLKRDVADLQRRIRLLQSTVLRKPAADASSEPATRVRFVAKGLRSQRERLGLSAADYATLAGVSPQTIYNWEGQVTRPRTAELARLASIRNISKREAMARIEQLRSRAAKGARKG